jgi:putative ABC transport system permease protein
MTGLLARMGRALLRVFPPGFRARFGEDVADYFTTRSREIRARRGLVGVVLFWLRGVGDVVRAAAAERREERAVKGSAGGIVAGGRGFDLGSDVRLALRSLRRTPGFTLAVLLTLALGIGATTAMFSVLDVALGRALPFRDPEQLVLGRATFSGNVNPWVSFPDYMDYRDEAGSLQSLATIGGGASTVTVTGADEPRQAALTFVTANLFETLGVRPQIGRSFSIEELPAGGGGEVVISHDFWQQWFGGSPDVVGRSLVVDGSPLTVAGVMPAGFRFMYDTDLWAPPWPGNSDPTTRRFHNWLLVGRMRPGVSLVAARADVDVVSTRLQEAYPESNRNKALQLDDLHGAMVEGHRQSLLLLTGAIVLVLLIACGNVAGLLMARGSARAPELAVRAAMGAGRYRLTRQLLVECTVLALAAGAVGVAIAVALQALVLRFVSMDLLGIRGGGLSLTMLGIALGLSVGTILLFGVFPSLAASRANPAEDLKEGGRQAGSRGGTRLRNGLVVLQVAVSLALLVGSGLLLRSFTRLRGVDPGFRVERLLTATVSLPTDRYSDPERRVQFFEELKAGIEALPGVESVGLVSRLPILQPAGNYAIWNPEHPPEGDAGPPWADRRVILPGYLETMGIRLIEGRGPEESDVAGSSPVIVLSKRTADVAVDMGRDEPGLFEVVGVVADHRGSSLAGGVRPAMFFPYAQLPVSTMRLAVAATDPLSLVRPIQARLWELDRNVLLGDARTMEDAVSGSVSGARSVTTVLSAFAAVAVALAALGLYGVLAYFVSRRMHEIGIRVALGATAGNVLRLVVTRGLTLVATGLVLGIGGAFGATRLVKGMLFQTSGTDPLTFAGVTGFFFVVALGACLLPAWKALRVDPVEAFRAE